MRTATIRNCRVTPKYIFPNVWMKYRAFVHITDLLRSKDIKRILSECFLRKTTILDATPYFRRIVSAALYRADKSNRSFGLHSHPLFRAICLGFRGIPAQRLKSSQLIPRDNPLPNRRNSRSLSVGRGNDVCSFAFVETRLRKRLSVDSWDSPPPPRLYSRRRAERNLLICWSWPTTRYRGRIVE